MDIVVRTPHGVADIAVRSSEIGTTVQDVVRLVTGQAVPTVAEVDGRAIDTNATLDEAGLMMGSVIDTTAAGRPTQPPAVALLQLAGRGAGSIRPLPPGRYRLGPGRRLNADELETAAVEITALELTVGDDGSVEARPGYSGPVLINGRRISEPIAWQGGMLTVGGRVFAIESPPRQFASRELPRPDARGMVAFNRPPRSGDDGPRQLVVDAVRDAASARPTLWHHRSGDLAAFIIPVGLAGDPPGPITVDIATERGVALVGDIEFTAGLARTILVEATTLHGPADLDIAIATRPEQLGRWDWSKWLPHLRSSGAPSYISTEPQLHEWVAQLQARAVGTAGQLSPAHLTVLVVDDPQLWTQRDSPLVSLLASHPVGLRVLTLAATTEQSPAACSAIITERPDGLAHLVVPDRQVDVDGIVPALTGIETACTVARHLAPLDDNERPTRATFSTFEPGPASLRELFHPIPTDVEGMVETWRRCPSPLPEWLRVPVGLSAGERLSANIGPDRNILVAGTRPELAADVAIGIVGAMAAQLPPAALSIVHVAAGASAAMDRIDDLPHSAGRFHDPGAAAATRLIVRLAHAVGGLDPGRERVVVVLDDAPRVAEISPGLPDGLIELADAVPALQLLMTTDGRRTDLDRGQRSSFAVQVTVDDTAGHPRGSLRIDSERLHLPFVPYAHPEMTPGPRGLVVGPAVYGRQLTSLERRLDLLARRSDAATGEGELGRFVTALSAAADRLDSRPGASLVPPSMPALHRSETLLAERLGDAIPLGLIDLPERLDVSPLWWQPGEHGSMLFLGSPRSGVDGALATLILGAAARFSADDLHVYSIDPLGRRRAAAALLPHTGLATSPDRADEVMPLLAWLVEEIERRRVHPAEIADAPALLLMVHDVGQLRRQLADHDEHDRRLDVIARAADVNVNIVATAWRVEEAGVLIDLLPERLVGHMADPADYDVLGVVDPAAIEGQLGRCWSTTNDRLVQLATPPSSLADEVGRLRTEPASVRPPVRPNDSHDPAGRS